MSADLFPKHKIRKSARYHALTLLADKEGRAIVDAQSHWIGFDPHDDRIELRGLREIYPDRLADLLENLGEPFQVVNDGRDFAKWYLSGGHGIVKRSLIEQFMPQQLQPDRCIRKGRSAGFTSVDLLPEHALQRAPTPKLRMKVLQRDQRRCLSCGQRPTDDVNVVLHTHHIHPFGDGGLTVEENLITLCHTCHSGLDPHNDSSLHELIGQAKHSTGEDAVQRHLEGVMNWRKLVSKDLLGS